MKSMKQMQNEMLNQCKFDGNYPKPVHMGIGIIAIARSKEEEDELNKDANRSLTIGVFGGIFMFLVILSLVYWIA